MTETLDQLESSRARHAHEASTQRKRADRLYEKLRLLENAIRDEATRRDETAAWRLANLYRRVPKHPRPTIAQLRQGRRK